MTLTALLSELSLQRVDLTIDEGQLRYHAPKGAMGPTLRQAIAEHKAALLQLLSAPPPDFLSTQPCPICGSRERWQWVDARELCRVCVILDLPLAEAMAAVPLPRRPRQWW
jgi:hypothetical protein